MAIDSKQPDLDAPELKGNGDDLCILGDAAVELAAEILQASRDRESSEEKNRSAMMARMMHDEDGKKFTIAMADQVLRMRRPARAADRMNRLVDQYGVPKYFTGFDQLAFRVGTTMADWMPSIVMPQIRKKVRDDSSHVIISAEQDDFKRYLANREQEKIRVNFNQLGEAVLGDREADRRLNDNIERLKSPGIDYISIKLSAIVSQISLTGYEATIEKIKPRLRSIYRAAIEGGGASGSKFVNLDMEEYRDLDLTVSVFTSVLDEPEFEAFEAGIVLQAYLPDSFSVLQSLTDWAIARKKRTGAGIKIRLVKGANLAMEQVEASLEDWPQAPYRSKLEVDANFKRMLEYSTRPEHADAVRIGVGSHNLFDIALAMQLRKVRNVANQVEFEMLEGMANAQSEEVRDRTGGILVYSPVVLDEEFEAAIAYLVRRLDENTAPGSFLGALFALRKGSEEWEEQKQAFLDACHLAQSDELSRVPNRTQNRLTESISPSRNGDPFHNEPDTDFSLPQNRQWSQQIGEKWKEIQIETIPVQIGGEFRSENPSGEGSDPSRPGLKPYHYCRATKSEVDEALTVAIDAQQHWNRLERSKRSEILRSVGAEIAKGRADAIGSMLVDAGKSIHEADVEISEAVDFANYYAGSLESDGWFDGTELTPFGVVVVTPPWNFPYAIPAGGVLAALMAGNSVILKPAPEAVLVAWQLVKQFWDAGVPKDVLQFVPTDDGEIGKSLVSDPRVGAVVLTGSIHTANLFLSWRPEMRVFAETSGKNAMIITSAADVDLAVKDLVRGAFGHAGQKCSATSLALVEKDVYHSRQFRQQLKDAAASLTIGGSWDPSATVTPIIREPDENLHRGLTQLDEGESWLLEPKIVDDNPCLWSPGIRMDVQPGSWYHQVECFGPVLGVICVEDLDEAIAIQNSSSFGLTGGLHSLDPDEIDRWRESVEVGNAYINRTTTGAIVRRQPFGGWKDSCVGPGPKAGGPNYVSTFGLWQETDLPTLRSRPAAETRSVLSRLRTLVTATLEPDPETPSSDGDTTDGRVAQRLTVAAENYAYWFENEFGIEHDPSDLHGENNHFRYRARPFHLVNLHQVEPADCAELMALVALACKTTSTKLIINVSPVENEETFDTELQSQLRDWAKRFTKACGATFQEHHTIELVEQLKSMDGGTLRCFGVIDRNQFAPAVIGNLPIIENQPLANGRIELLNYLKEQSISETIHRYGNIFE
ncbi:MAG: bifunctional proline dehydrogenase/L-glutamate gamma-semialdehyde dehydrogenase [Planctomycetota bacterium]